MRDDGTTGNPIIEVNQSNDPNIRNLPTLRHANVALNTANLGRKFTFQLAVYNREGETKSVAVAYLFATKPVAPSQPLSHMSWIFEIYTLSQEKQIIDTLLQADKNLTWLTFTDYQLL